MYERRRPVGPRIAQYNLAVMLRRDRDANRTRRKRYHGSKSRSAGHGTSADRAGARLSAAPATDGLHPSQSPMKS